MGYNIHQQGSCLKIKPGLGQELKDLSKEINGKVQGKYYKSFELVLGKNGEVHDLEFCGQKAWWTEDEYLQSVAHCFEDGSYIEMSGEDGAMWRWYFKNGKVYEVCPQIIWEEPDGPSHIPQKIKQTFDVQVVKE